MKLEHHNRRDGLLPFGYWTTDDAANILTNFEINVSATQLI